LWHTIMRYAWGLWKTEAGEGPARRDLEAELNCCEECEPASPASQTGAFSTKPRNFSCEIS
jgi:hypothetical protein